MSGGFFAGAYGGDLARLAPEARLECKICWYQYDPAQGDAVWQVPPGIPFAELPEQWSCPTCGADKAAFLLVEP